MKLVVSLALALLFPIASAAQITIATDNASNYATWTGNPGSGFTSWAFLSQNDGGFAGHFLSTNSNAISTSTKSWGMYSNGGGTRPVAAAFRGFSAPLEIGQTVTIDLIHGSIASGGKVGFHLRTNNVTDQIANISAWSRFQFSFEGGDTHYEVFDEGSHVSTGLGFTTGGVRVAFTLATANTYNLKVTRLSDNAEFTLTGRGLGGVTNNGFNSIAIFSDDVQEGDVFFNSLSVTSPGTVQISNSAGWRMMASPVGTSLSDILHEGWTQGATSGADVTNGSPNVYTRGASAWQTVTNLTTTQATAASGFIYYHFNDDDKNGVTNASPTTLTVAGSEFAAPGTLNFTNGGAGAAVGWNLLGNPFASTIDWDAISPSLSNVDGTVYVYTNVSPDVAALGEGFNSYIAWNGSAGSLAGGLIAPFQGFFVKASDATASLGITASAKSTGGSFRNKDAAEAPRFALRLSDGRRHNDAWFSFTSDGELGMDAQDAYKLDPLDGTFISLFSTIDGVPMDIQNLPASLVDRLEIPISIKSMTDLAGADGEFELSLSSLNGLDEAWDILLFDHDTGTEVDLRSGTHAFRWTAPREKMRPVTERMGDPILSTAAATAPRFTLIIDPASSTSTKDDGRGTMDDFQLEQNFPNPFNPSTQIRFTLQSSHVTRLTVYDVLGREVAVLVDGQMPAGAHSVTFDASNLTSGVYLYKLEAGGMSMTKRMTLVK